MKPPSVLLQSPYMQELESSHSLMSVQLPPESSDQHRNRYYYRLTHYLGLPSLKPWSQWHLNMPTWLSQMPWTHTFSNRRHSSISAQSWFNGSWCCVDIIYYNVPGGVQVTCSVVAGCMKPRSHSQRKEPG